MCVDSAVVGCDGIKSKTREILLGVDARAVFSGKYACEYKNIGIPKSQNEHYLKLLDILNQILQCQWKMANIT